MSEAAIPMPLQRPKTGLGRWLREALPSWHEAFAGGMLWAAMAVATIIIGLRGEGWQDVRHIGAVAFLYGLGAFIAFPLALWLARLAPRRSPEAAFATFFLALAVATIGITAILFGLQYRLYYAEWHAAPLSVMWLIQFIHTLAGAVFQFAVLGVRLYFPVGFAALFVAAFWFQRRMR